MATKSYVFIETAVGKTRDVSAHSRQCLVWRQWIPSVDGVTGTYDINAVMTADLNSIGQLVPGKVHNIGGVLRT